MSAYARVLTDHATRGNREIDRSLEDIEQKPLVVSPKKTYIKIHRERDMKNHRKIAIEEVSERRVQRIENDLEMREELERIIIEHDNVKETSFFRFIYAFSRTTRGKEFSCNDK